MAKIQIEIEKCDKCPFHYTERTITADSFECALDYYCGVNKKKLPNMWNGIRNYRKYPSGAHIV